MSCVLHTVCMHNRRETFKFCLCKCHVSEMITNGVHGWQCCHLPAAEVIDIPGVCISEPSVHGQYTARCGASPLTLREPVSLPKGRALSVSLHGLRTHSIRGSGGGNRTVTSPFKRCPSPILPVRHGHRVGPRWRNTGVSCLAAVWDELVYFSSGVSAVRK